MGFFRLRKYDSPKPYNLPMRFLQLRFPARCPLRNLITTVYSFAECMTLLKMYASLLVWKSVLRLCLLRHSSSHHLPTQRCTGWKDGHWVAVVVETVPNCLFVLPKPLILNVTTTGFPGPRSKIMSRCWHCVHIETRLLSKFGASVADSDQGL